jgi:hypothetical protein
MMRGDDDAYAAQTAAFLDCLIERLDPEADPQAFPGFLESLTWTNDDNGHAVERVRREWLRTGDRTRATLALALSGTYPGRTRDELVANVSAAAERFPQLQARAQELIGSWDTHIEPKRRQADSSAVPAPTPAPIAASAAMTMTDAVEFIADHTADAAPPKFAAELIDELLPCLRDNAQAQVFAVRDAWSASDDEWRVGIAAWMEVPAPGEAEGEIARRRAAAAARFPRIAVGDSDLKWSGRL